MIEVAKKYRMKSLYLKILVVPWFFLLFGGLGGCGGESGGPAAPYVPPSGGEEPVEGLWQDVLAGDDHYPVNVYLTSFVEWVPGVVGKNRRGKYTDEDGRPLESFTAMALGPPEGSGSHTSGTGSTCPVGINGWGVWKFDESFVIVNGTGPDFTTFTKTFAWGSKADGLCCELAHVEVSEDGENWYVCTKEEYDENSDPGSANDDYVYAHVRNIHGNAPTWANFRKGIQAEVLKNGVWEKLPGMVVEKYFRAGDPYLGGVSFDLSDFSGKEAPHLLWPEEGRMRYLKIVDDAQILDGQDYAPDWCLGANLMAAMGLNIQKVP